MVWAKTPADGGSSRLKHSAAALHLCPNAHPPAEKNHATLKQLMATFCHVATPFSLCPPMGDEGGSDARFAGIQTGAEPRALARRAAAAVPANDELGTVEHQTLRIHGQCAPLAHLSGSFVSLW